MEKVKRLAGLLAGSGAIVALDQVTKSIIRSRLAFGEVYEPIPELASFIRIVHWRNTGAAFGIFPDGGIIFAVIALLVIGAIIYYYPQIPIKHRLLRLALMLQLAGAVGNLIDRITLGPVTDFIAVGSFPVFNVADASISIGVGLLILSMWLEEHEQERIEEADSMERVSEAEPEVG